MLAAVAILLQSDDAWKTLSSVIDGYTKHDTFQCTLVHDNSSGLFPGRYEQSLKWKKGGRFELKVTKPTTFTPREGNPGSVAPDFYSNGKEVTAAFTNRPWTQDEIQHDKNSMPGWEVSTGLLLV